MRYQLGGRKLYSSVEAPPVLGFQLRLNPLYSLLINEYQVYAYSMYRGKGTRTTGASSCDGTVVVRYKIDKVCFI